MKGNLNYDITYDGFALNYSLLQRLTVNGVFIFDYVKSSSI